MFNQKTKKEEKMKDYVKFEDWSMCDQRSVTFTLSKEVTEHKETPIGILKDYVKWQLNRNNITVNTEIEEAKTYKWLHGILEDYPSHCFKEKSPIKKSSGAY